MRLPNWFKILWWVLITSGVTWFLYVRYPDLIAGRATAVDVVAFVVWIALMLAPLFQEITLLGLTFRQEVKELKQAVGQQLSQIRADVRNAIDVHTTINPQFVMPAPAADSQLPEIERRIKAAVSDALVAYGVPPKATAKTAELHVDDDVALLFFTRYHIEKELRRIVQSRDLAAPQWRRAIPAFQVARMLVETELMEPRLANAIREVYAVCSPAIHGEPVTAAQVSFVREVGPELINALRAIQ
jgi:hypothetical protein